MLLVIDIETFLNSTKAYDRKEQDGVTLANDPEPIEKKKNRKGPTPRP